MMNKSREEVRSIKKFDLKNVKLANKLRSKEIEDLIGLEEYSQNVKKDEELFKILSKIHDNSNDEKRSDKTFFSIGLKIKFSNQLNENEKLKIFDLFESNMKEIYEKGSNYSKSSKFKELFNFKSKFIIIDLIKRIEGLEEVEMIGYLMWRFDYEDSLIENQRQSVTYCYELQIDKTFKGLKFGSRLMEILRLISKEFFIEKIMLTVQIVNKSALNFYKKLNFEIDEISPSNFGERTDYEILSKIVF